MVGYEASFIRDRDVGPFVAQGRDGLISCRLTTQSMVDTPRESSATRLSRGAAQAVVLYGHTGQHLDGNSVSQLTSCAPTAGWDNDS